jgi:hypothetical protein
MARLIYLGCYSHGHGRGANPAAMNMMDYIIDSINSTGKELAVLSTASMVDGTGSERDRKSL